MGQGADDTDHVGFCNVSVFDIMLTFYFPLKTCRVRVKSVAFSVWNSLGSTVFTFEDLAPENEAEMMQSERAGANTWRTSSEKHGLGVQGTNVGEERWSEFATER